jgi:Methyltransferase domain
MKSASSIKGVNAFRKIAYAFKLLRMKVAGGRRVIGSWDEVDEYQAVLKQYDQQHISELTKHKVLEIGFGARPWRLLTMASLGVDVVGIDLDQPAYEFNVPRLLSALRKNGFERFAKSLVRSLLFDHRDLRLLEAELQQRGKSLAACNARLHVGNAAEKHHFAPNSFTFIYSEDVFEHIPSAMLTDVVENMYRWLVPRGMALIRPNVYTGITGGHDPDYYAHKVQRKEIDPGRAWAHLWDSEFEVNTYLNKMRVPDYVALFEKQFHIIAVKQKHDRLGVEYLSNIRNKLPGIYSDEELLTNQVAFILKSRKENC